MEEALGIASGDISKQVKYQINEAYDNALLEEYGAKDLFTEAVTFDEYIP